MPSWRSASPTSPSSSACPEWELPDWLAAQARRRPQQPAIETPDLRWTYRQLLELAGHGAQVLGARGLGRGDRVALLIQRGELFALWLHALMQRGGVAVPLNWRLTPAELQFQLQDSGAALLVHDAAMTALAESLEAPCPVMAAGLPQPDARPAVRERFDLADPQALIYTSGTTGRPKAAVLSYRNHLFAALGSSLQLGLDLNERWLVPMPLFHVGGLGVLMRSLIYGTTAVLHDRFREQAVDQALRSSRATLVSLVPTMLARLLDQCAAPYPPSLRAVLLGGGPAPRALLERAADLGVPVCQSYGMTETNAQFTTLPPSDALRKLGSAGLPLAGNELRLLGAGGAPLPPGEEGEIWVRGPTLVSGYHNRPEESAAAFQDGWFRTGDLGLLDPEGYLYVLDRRSDLIVSGGENVYPSEVEAALLRHPAVAEAAVVAQPDSRWGQVPRACVVLVPGASASEEELTAFCREHLAGYKVPKRWEFLPALPRNASGKILKHLLRQSQGA